MDLLEAESEKTTIRTAEPNLTYANPRLTRDVSAEFRHGGSPPSNQLYICEMTRRGTSVLYRHTL